MIKGNEIQNLVIDATNGAVGRIASFAAKQALLGKEIVIVNCNEALITGQKADIIEKYKQARARGGTALRGPNFPRSPERIMKRTVRGMLPYKKGKGLEALKRVICYNSIPKEFENSKKESLIRDLRTKAIKLSELSRII